MTVILPRDEKQDRTQSAAIEMATCSSLPVPRYPQSPSPLYNHATLQGIFDATHHSNASISYRPATLPTPWPVLLTGLLWSLLSVCFSILSDPTTASQIRDLCLSLIGSIRGITAVVAAIQAMANVGGHFRPPSAAVVLFLSCVSHFFKSRGFSLSYLLTLIGSLCSFLTIALMVGVRARSKNDYYGKWFLSGGNCPIVMDAFALTTCDWSAYVGCGLDKIPRTQELYDSNSALYDSYVGSINPNTYKMKNRLVVVEFILGFLLLGPGCIFLLLALVFLLWVFWYIAELIMSVTRNPFGTHELDLTDKSGVVLTTVMVVVVVTAVYIATSFPLHYVQERQPTAFLVLDSYGPLAEAQYNTSNNWDFQEIVPGTWTGNAVNGTSWSDYFYVETPVDELGFLSHWWQGNRDQVANWLAVM